MVGIKPAPGDKGVYKQDTVPEPVAPAGFPKPKSPAKAFLEEYAEEVALRREQWIDGDGMKGFE